MVITDDMIEYIAKLAKLRLEENEKESAKEELGKIIDYMDVLNQVDTEGIEAMSHAFPVKNVFREDVVKDSTDRDIITSNAPNKKDGCFKVPMTVE
ncbi:MAG: Asp-tRNA(Asn)/Glu-tRNA(Gln) amidotransferase subunit GatC [Clostridiales bacterium]|nr:Asp-tRNA(Asn)/Glu-tRNA(Gln) amidotransferase subunit GatC [Clostridiales bacterium]